MVRGEVSTFVISEVKLFWDIESSQNVAAVETRVMELKPCKWPLMSTR